MSTNNGNEVVDGRTGASFEPVIYRARFSVGVLSHKLFVDNACAVGREFPQAQAIAVVGLDTIVRIFDPVLRREFERPWDDSPTGG